MVVNDANGQQRNKLYPLQVAFKRYGQSGLEVSDWFHVGSCADDLAVIRSMWLTMTITALRFNSIQAGTCSMDATPPLEPGSPTGWVPSIGILPQFVTMGPRFFDTKDGHYLGPALRCGPLNLDRDQPLDYAQPEHSLSSTRQRDNRLTHRLNQFRRGAFLKMIGSKHAFNPTNSPFACNARFQPCWILSRKRHPFAIFTDWKTTSRGLSADNCLLLDAWWKRRPIHSDHARGWCGWRMGCAQWPQGKP